MNSKVEIPYSLVLHPNAQEFANFSEFWEKTEQDPNLENYGIIKVVPPAKWVPRVVPIEKEMNNIMVNSPIEQNILSQGNATGIYELLLMAKKSMTVKDYRKKVEGFDDFTKNKNPDDVESLFWKNIGFSPPLYGADMPGSLFDEGVSWNLRELNGVLKEGLNRPIAGVNKPYLYVGSWKTMFGWHKEDLDLYSINFVHYGKPKFWYCIPTSEGPKLEAFVKKHFPEAFSKCKEYLRHKTIMISPYLLKQNIPDLKIHKMIQHPGEFIITLGGAYHAGFNWGFNLAEAVNFATTKWLDLFPFANCCKCIRDAVKIDKDDFYTNLTLAGYAEHPAVKKYVEEHGLNIDPSQRKLTTSASTAEVRVTRSHTKLPKHEAMEEQDNPHNERDTLTEETSNEENQKMAEESSGPTSSVTTRSSAHSKRERQSKLANKIIDSNSHKKHQKSEPAEEIQDAECDNKKKMKSTSDLDSKSKKIKKKAVKPEKASKKFSELEGDSDVICTQCELCSKWRRISDMELLKKLEEKQIFNCQEGGTSCDQPQESWPGYDVMT